MSSEPTSPTAPASADPRLPGFGWAIGMFFISTALVLVFGSLSQAIDVTAGLIFTELALILAPPLLVARLKGFDLRETFSWRRPAAADVLLALIAAGCAWVLAIQGTHWLTDLAGADSRTLAALRPTAPALIAAMAIFPPCEEVLFRGFIFTGLRGRYRPIPAMVLTAFLFGVYHQDPVRIPAALFLGLVAGTVLLRSGSLVPAMLMHFVSNLCAGVLGSTQWSIQALPWWQLLAAAAGLGLCLALIGRSRERRAFEAPARPRSPRVFYLVAGLILLGNMLYLPLYLDLIIWQDVLTRNATIQFDRYRMRDNYWYRKESTIVLWGDGVERWNEQGHTLGIPRGDGFVSASIGGEELPYRLEPESTVRLTLPEPPAPGTVVEVVCKGRFRPGQPHRFPSHPFVPTIGIRATIDLREAPGLRFHDSGFRVKTPMFITYPQVGDWGKDGGWCEERLVPR